jgi:LmbE family N-acetylglucosaminyl deacetylase/AmiR/NasT family two-component response regulator
MGADVSGAASGAESGAASGPESGASRGRILLIDDDRVFGIWAAQVLQKRGGYELRHLLDPVAGLRCVETEPWDLVITDIEMPGMTGLELLEQVHRLEPGLPVAVVTAHATVDYAVTALRSAAVEFMHKPMPATDFLSKVGVLVANGQAMRSANRESVLAIGAHPDDVEIGAAGALLAHKAAGDLVSILTLSRGARGGTEEWRVREAEAAAKVIGARLFLNDLEDTRIAEGDPTIGIIDGVIAEIQPTVVYTHSVHDVHQDHRNTYRAVMVAARRIGRVYCYQSPSATVDFRPTFFVGIDDYLGLKLDAIRAFASQFAIRDYLEPDLIAATARYWSRFCDGSHAEAFEGIRDRAPTRAAQGQTRAATSRAAKTGAEDEDQREGQP